MKRSPDRSKLVPYSAVAEPHRRPPQWGVALEPSKNSLTEMWTHGPRDGYQFRFLRRRGKVITELKFGLSMRGMLALHRLLCEDRVMEDLRKELARAQKKRVKK